MDFQQMAAAQNQLKQRQMGIPKGKPFVKKGRQLTECSGVSMVVYNHYQILKRVGDGAYGVVFKAIDTSKNNELVAIKKMTEAFRDPRDAKRILREIKLLKFCDHPNIIKLKDIIKPETPTGYHDIYLVMEFMEIDLDKTINSEQPLAPRLIQSMMWQLLNGIYYMHSADIIHRDIKPSNILLLKNCTLKLADMNLARKFDLDERITEYVVTRPYRAPEILLSSQNYSKPIDIWSAGCIFAEMMGRKTIFKGTSQLNQLDRIVAIIGKPDFDKLSYKVDEHLREYIQKFSNKQPENFYEIYSSHDKLAVDLLYKMLAFDPKDRWTVEQCLHHQYFASFSKDKLKACDQKFDWSFDEIQEKNEIIQRAIYNESCVFHPDEPDATEEEIEAHVKQQQILIQKQIQQKLLAQKQEANNPGGAQQQQQLFMMKNGIPFQMAINQISQKQFLPHANINFPGGIPPKAMFQQPNINPLLMNNAYQQALLNQLNNKSANPFGFGQFPIAQPIFPGQMPMPMQKNQGNPFNKQNSEQSNSGKQDNPNNTAATAPTEGNQPNPGQANINFPFLNQPINSTNNAYFTQLLQQNALNNQNIIKPHMNINNPNNSTNDIFKKPSNNNPKQPSEGQKIDGNSIASDQQQSGDDQIQSKSFQQEEGQVKEADNQEKKQPLMQEKQPPREDETNHSTVSNGKNNDTSKEL